MKKCILYPFYDEFYNMFPILEEQNDLIITKFVMPKGWKTKKRRSKIDITYDFYNALYGCDLVIFIETRHNQYMHDDICHKIQESIKNGKDVKCMENLSKEEIKVIKKLAEGYKVKFEYGHRQSIEVRTKFNPYYEPNALVIGIGKLLNNMGTFSILCQCVKGYHDRGFKVSIISNNGNNQLFGFNSYPTGKFSPESINRLIRKIEDRDNPDVIILDFPDSIMKYSNRLYNNFGVYSYIISQAVSIDYFILVSQVLFYNEDLCDHLKKLVNYRFDCDLDAIYISNYYFDEGDSDEMYKLIIRESNDEKSIESIYHYNSECANIVPIYNKETIDDMIQNSIQNFVSEIEMF